MRIVKKSKVKNPGISKKTAPEEAKLTYLDPTHLLQLETLTRDVETERLKMCTEEQCLRNKILELELLESKHEVLKYDIQRQKNIVSQAQSGYTNKGNHLDAVTKELMKQYGYDPEKGEFSYHKITGELK